MREGILEDVAAFCRGLDHGTRLAAISLLIAAWAWRKALSLLALFVLPVLWLGVLVWWSIDGFKIGKMLADCNAALPSQSDDSPSPDVY